MAVLINKCLLYLFVKDVEKAVLKLDMMILH